MLCNGLTVVLVPTFGIMTGLCNPPSSQRSPDTRVEDITVDTRNIASSILVILKVENISSLGFTVKLKNTLYVKKEDFLFESL